MTATNPIVPPPELRRQWLDNDHFPMVTGTHDLLSITRDRLNSVMDQATQWGYQQAIEELETLSPAAQSVMDAYNSGFDRPVAVHHKPRIAAALRAAADQVVPEQECQIYGLTQRENERQQVREEILAIAAELEAQ